MIGRVLGGRYRLTHELGRGATAVVFRAVDLTLGTDVAVKVLAPHLARDSDTLARFERELAAARQITSEAVVQVYELGKDGGTSYVVMEFGPSGTLKEHILLNGALPLVRLDQILEQLADALVACHERGILHRDLKPSNILFDPATGKIKIIDFGIARVADRPLRQDAVGSVVGTPEYMAPEQFEDLVPDPRSDLYAAGAVLYEAATGQLAISGRTLPEVVRKHRDGVQVPPRRLNRQIGPGLEAIILRLLLPDPGDRFQTAEELRNAVSGVVSSEPSVSATRARASSPSRETIDRRTERASGCPRCGARREQGLPYCPSCGRSLARFDRFGRWSVLVSAVPRGESLARFLEPRLPPEATRHTVSERSLPVVAVQFASEPLARWLADELRSAGFAASVRRLPLTLLALATLVAYILGNLLSYILVMTFSQQAPAAFLIIGALLAILPLLFMLRVARGYWKRHFVAFAFLPPLRQPPRLGSLVTRVLEIQRHLTSPRLRRIGRDLLVHAFRRQAAVSDVNTDALVASAYTALAALDLQLGALRTDELPTRRASREDAILRGTQCLLRIGALCRRESAAAIRQTAGRLAQQTQGLDERRQRIENESTLLESVIDDLQSLGSPPAPRGTRLERPPSASSVRLP